MKEFTTCPLCGCKVEDGSLLIVYWYAPMKWWVTLHLMAFPIDNLLDPLVTGKCLIWMDGERYKVKCYGSEIQSVSNLKPIHTISTGGTKTKERTKLK